MDFQPMMELPPSPRYAKIDTYVISLEYVHGVMMAPTENRSFPYQVFVTYTDKTSVVLDMTSKDKAIAACDKIAERLGAT